MSVSAQVSVSECRKSAIIDGLRGGGEEAEGHRATV
jgi:hypothetical protein